MTQGATARGCQQVDLTPRVIHNLLLPKHMIRKALD